MTRITEITSAEQVAEADRSILEAVVAGRGSVVGPYRLLLHQPQLAHKFFGVSEQLRQDFKSNLYLFELTILCAAGIQRCGYVWEAHARSGKTAGLSDPTISAIQENRPAELSDDDRRVYDLVHELVEQHRASDATYQRAEERYGSDQLVEIIALAGYYTTLCLLLNGFELPAPSELAAR